MCDNSIYSYQNQICEGFITVRGGHRIGITGNCVIENNKVTNIEILDTLDHYYDSMIKNTNYLDKLIDNQNNLDSVDAVSGATYTSKYLKEMLKDTLKYHEG